MELYEKGKATQSSWTFEQTQISDDLAAIADFSEDEDVWRYKFFEQQEFLSTFRTPTFGQPGKIEWTSYGSAKL